MVTMVEDVNWKHWFGKDICWLKSLDNCYLRFENYHLLVDRDEVGGKSKFN
jgi:hypothetical protein